ncbi:MAG TPA: hypothetical protein VFM61_00595 [Pseudidiomarina sp.]|nr:hypothetical protein [Pseudidiomarina sp.]
MNRMFWVALVLVFVFVDVTFAEFMLAFIVGGLDLAAAYERAYGDLSFNDYWFFAAWRSLPYIALVLLAALSSHSKARAGRCILWLLLVALALFHFYGYWVMQSPLFTDERTSSTAILAVIDIPLIALIYGTIGYVVCLIGYKIYGANRKSD